MGKSLFEKMKDKFSEARPENIRVSPPRREGMDLENYHLNVGKVELRLGGFLAHEDIGVRYIYELSAKPAGRAGQFTVIVDSFSGYSESRYNRGSISTLTRGLTTLYEKVEEKVTNHLEAQTKREAKNEGKRKKEFIRKLGKNL